jgi:hypothetical protein
MNDFRKENYIKAWKDDVLQLYNVMWYVPILRMDGWLITGSHG